ncbi:MAG TPA: histone deacetylase [Xanthomonadales bacterium]|nr:histone deacetylase [Xanthomonadales bacterium]
MKAYYCDHFVLPLPAGHRFPMAKYARLRARVAQAAPTLGIELVEPEEAGIDDLERAHDRDYVRRVSDGGLSPAEVRRIGFPWSPAMVSRSRRSSGGTIGALRAALAGDGVGVNLAGGTHHAFANQGGGYCVFNDTVVAARHVQAHGLARRLLVIDLDVHQGDGTAAICAGDDSIWTLSLHGERNYPATKQRSDLDVPLRDGCGDDEYLAALAGALAIAVPAARADAAIFLAGADPYAGDRLGHLALSREGLAARDRLVFDTCRSHHLPVAVTMAGGYAEDVDEIVGIHFATVAAAAASAAAWAGSRV